jgi:hypothetical protein
MASSQGHSAQHAQQAQGAWAGRLPRRNLGEAALQGQGGEENPMRTRAALVLLAVAFAPFASAQPPASQKAPDITGTYTLVTVNGDKVPATITHDDVSITIRGGSFVIAADGSCVSRMVILAPNGQEVSREVAGSYTRDGSKVTIQWQGAGVTEGAADGKTFTMDNAGMVLSYRK